MAELVVIDARLMPNRLLFYTILEPSYLIGITGIIVVRGHDGGNPLAHDSCQTVYYL
jgi:hypothetical protein